MPPAKGPVMDPLSSRRGRAGAFGALVAQATVHPEAALALAQAYASLPTDERQRLVGIVAADAPRHGAHPGSALALLLGVEPDPNVASIIADTMYRHGDWTWHSRYGLEAWMSGDLTSGAAVLVRPLHGPFGEAMWVRWDAERLLAGHEPLLRWADREAIVHTLGPGPALKRWQPDGLIDTLALVLWRHRREGRPWPAALADRFADVFDPSISALVGR